jgi:aquaporin Z
LRPHLAEALGTFALVFAGTGAIIVDDVSGGALSHVGVSLVFGLVVLAMILVVGEVSGAHLNPAVTFGFLCSRRLGWRRALSYAASQSAGAFAASLVLRALFSSHAGLGATLPTGTLAQVFSIEVVITALLVFVILGVSFGDAGKRSLAGVAVGATVALAALVAGPISGASMNPARSLAPALVSGNLAGLWIYLSAPFAGAWLGVLACRRTQAPGCCDGAAPRNRACGG